MENNLKMIKSGLELVVQIFERIKNAGVKEEHSVGFKLRLKIMNVICLMIIFTGAVIIPIVNIQGFSSIIFSFLKLTLLFGSVIALNFAGHTRIARVLLILIANALVFYITCRDLYVEGSRYYFFLLPLGMVILFDITEKVKIIIGILFALFNYVLVYVYDFSAVIPPVNFSTDTIVVHRYLSFFVYLVLISLMSYFFVNGNRLINNELNNEQRRYNDLERLAGVGNWRLYPGSWQLAVSAGMKSIVRLKKEAADAINMRTFYRSIIAADRRKVYDSIKRAITNSELTEVSYRIKAGNSLVYVTSRAVPVKDNSGVTKYVDGTLIDSTRQREIQSNLAAHLKEKETLLAEMHHRVKNNLAVISGLIQLQSFKVDDKAREQFIEIHNKIATIALIHEKFYQSETLTKINLVNFVQELEKQIIRTFPLKNGTVKTLYRIDDIFLDIQYAIPIALILNELISNSYKHAFRKTEIGKILIKIQKHAHGFILHYRDNGTGFQNYPDFKNPAYQGLTLIHMLVQSINYQYAYAAENGFYFSMYPKV